MADTLFDIKDGIAIVTLNRPEKLNSLTMVQLEELSQKANEFEQDDAVRAIIITATGKGFSTGADLSGGGGRPDMTTGMGMKLSAHAYGRMCFASPIARNQSLRLSMVWLLGRVSIWH